MKKIIWICSYPKSGNTWIRSIVSSLLYSKNGEFSFNLLNLIELFEKKSRYDFVKKVNISDYKNLNDDIEIISKYWLECQKNIVFDDSINPIYNIFKTHSANLSVNSNDFTNTNYTGGIIHVVRDPREVVISYSKHRGKSIDDTIETMSDLRTLSAQNNICVGLLSKWDLHYKSWKNLNVPSLLIKYEELINNTKSEIIKIKSFLSNILDLKENILEKKIDNILKTTNIENFRKHEINYGFEESSLHSSFFGNAKTNSWEKKLSKNQIKKIEELFKEIMNELNYV